MPDKEKKKYKSGIFYQGHLADEAMAGMEPAKPPIKKGTGFSRTPIREKRKKY